MCGCMALLQTLGVWSGSLGTCALQVCSKINQPRLEQSNLLLRTERGRDDQTCQMTKLLDSSMLTYVFARE